MWRRVTGALRAVFGLPPRRTSEPLEVLTVYQRHWHAESSGRIDDRYRTAALVRGADHWAVIGVDGQFRGEYEVTGA